MPAQKNKPDEAEGKGQDLKQAVGLAQPATELKTPKQYYVFREGSFRKATVDGAFFEANPVLWSARLSTGLFGLTTCPSGNRGPKNAGEVILGVGDAGLAKFVDLGFIPCPVCHPESSQYFSWPAISSIVSVKYNLSEAAEYADKARVPFDARRVRWDQIIGAIGDAPSRIYLPETLSLEEIGSFRAAIRKIVRTNGVAKEPMLGYYAPKVANRFVEYRETA